ncbi:MAG TPA: hypothetical protein VN317_08400 [Candidatus Methanoperedens sp.]|nr:hypothetical protein [Candidatus Methanoperedens sp.]
MADLQGHPSISFSSFSSPVTISRSKAKVSRMSCAGLPLGKA